MTIVVPYRDRESHLAQFIPHMRAYLPDTTILVVEQAEGKEWNRERLFNIGVIEHPDDYYIFNDVDHLPIFSYQPLPGVTQLASSTIQRRDFLGGVTMFDHDTYIAAGGYHNDFWGGRAGDNEMSFNLKRLGIPVLNRFGRFKLLPHPRMGPEFIPELWEQAQRHREVQNQLGACEYQVVSDTQEATHRHIIVEL